VQAVRPSAANHCDSGADHVVRLVDITRDDADSWEGEPEGRDAQMTATLQNAKLSRYSDGLRAERLGFDSRQGQEIVLSSTASRPDLGSPI
jgi:hypothetical protein